VDKARLLAAASPHSGDWLHAPPITAVGLRLSDEAIRVAVARRLGTKAYEPRTCLCGKAVDARGLHGLSFCRTGRRETSFLFQRLSMALQRGNAVSFHNTMVTE